jgi:hypothetical protein
MTDNGIGVRCRGRRRERRRARRHPCAPARAVPLRSRRTAASCSGAGTTCRTASASRSDWPGRAVPLTTLPVRWRLCGSSAKGRVVYLLIHDGSIASIERRTLVALRRGLSVSNNEGFRDTPSRRGDLKVPTLRLLKPLRTLSLTRPRGVSPPSAWQGSRPFLNFSGTPT